ARCRAADERGARGKARPGELPHEPARGVARAVVAALLLRDPRLRPERVVAADRRRELRVEAVELATGGRVVVELAAVDLADLHLRLGVAGALVAADRVALLAGRDEVVEVRDRLAVAAARLVDRR